MNQKNQAVSSQVFAAAVRACHTSGTPNRILRKGGASCQVVGFYAS